MKGWRRRGRRERRKGEDGRREKENERFLITLHFKRRPIPRRFHDPAQQDGDIRNLASSEDGGGLRWEKRGGLLARQTNSKI